MQEGSLFEATPTAAECTAGVFARVAVERGIDRLDGEPTLTYRCPDAAPAIGQTVRVPLGKTGTTRGVVIEVGDARLLGGIDPRRARAIESLGATRVPESLVSLAKWIAEYYVCPLGMVFAAMLPAAVKKETGQRSIEIVSRGSAADAPGLSRQARAVWERVSALDAALFPMPIKELAALLGLRATGTLRRLVEKGLLTTSRESRVMARALPDLGALGTALPPDIRPTDAQREIVEGIGAGLGSFGVHLLRGVTGSGKTEVYLRVMARALEAGLGCIVLVPEIALTPQTSERFTARFGTRAVAVLHSGLTAAQRHAEWARLAGGGARVVVGARSAVFAPIDRVGLVIVDEEHDGSYKQDRLPRYSARDVAIKRAQIEGATVILGSATPSLESWKRAGEGGYRLWELRHRVGSAVLPQVRVVDMREERRQRVRLLGRDDGRLHLLGPTLEAALERTLADDGQAILLLNRRGFAHVIACRDGMCGFRLTCDQCDALLVLHRHRAVPAGQLVRCHHCAAERLVPRLCPTCGKELAVMGAGTQRAEDELVRKFASMGLVEGQTLLRVDSDSMRSAMDYFDTLARFGRGEVRVLIGTQMIAKGLDFAGVRLVGVLDADTGLSIPDFRAGERAFQLISQVAGRAGRGAAPGLVIIQTLCPEHSAIRFAAAHDYVGFATEESSVRARAGLPPATRMARVVCRDPDMAKAQHAAEALAQTLRSAAAEGVRVIGPAPCTISRIANHWRFGIDVIAPRAGLVQSALSGARRWGLLKSDSRTAVDVDPVSLM